MPTDFISIFLQAQLLYYHIAASIVSSGNISHTHIGRYSTFSPKNKILYGMGIIHTYVVVVVI